MTARLALSPDFIRLRDSSVNLPANNASFSRSVKSFVAVLTKSD